MKKFASAVIKILACLVFCAALLCPARPARAESYMSCGTKKYFSFNVSAGVGYNVTYYGPARSSDTGVVQILSYDCSSSGLGGISVKAVKPGHATISMQITLYYGKWDSVLGYWREDTQYRTVSWDIEVGPCETHDYDRYIDVAPDVCSDGKYLYECSVCGDWYKTTIDAPHSYGDYVLTKNPTPTENGTQTKTCALCGKEVQIAYDKSHAAHFNTQPTSAYAKVGSKAAVSVNAGGDGLKYQWYIKNYGASSFGKSSIKTNTYSVTMNEDNTGRQVYCEITDVYGNKVKSNTVTLYSDALIKSQPKSVSAYRDDKVSVSVGAVGQGLTYEWYIRSAAGKTFSKSSVTARSYGFVMNDDRDGRQAYCIVRDKHGNEVKSSTVTFTMKPDRPVFITQQPQSVKVFEGEKASVSLKATGKEMSCQWYYKDPGMTKFVKTSTFKGNSYSVSMDESRDGRKVYCVITDCFGNKTQSDTVTLSMKHTAKITQQPRNVSAVNGEKVSTTVKATGDGLTYQWYVKAANGAEFTKSSITKATYGVIMSASVNGRKVYCVITDKYGNSVKTNTVTLKRSNNITITTQLKSVTVNDGKKAAVSFKAEGEGLTYQWYYKNPGADKFVKTSTFTGTSYAVTMSPDRHGRKVYCLITDKYGTTQKTATVTLGMNHPITISKQPANANVYYGKTASVSVAAKGYGLTYQWYVKNVGESKFAKSSVTGETYAVKMNESRDGRQIFCRITDRFGGTKDTKTVTLSMKNQITITRQPADTMVVKGAKAAVSFKAEGEELTYQWYFKDASASSFSKTSSFKGTSYSVTMSDERDGRQVYCKITDKYGYSVKTATVTLTADPKPIKIIYFSGTSGAYKGSTIKYFIEADGHGLTYQWGKARSNGMLKIEGATGSSYTDTLSEANYYVKFVCLITDQYGNTLEHTFAAVTPWGV